MPPSRTWSLPDGVEEILPPAAARMESLRRRIIDLFHSWGYELVMPPHIEYLESLLTGGGQDLDLQTYKLIDQQTGRLMGVRADMTPQVARVAARLRSADAPTRLCYSGTILTTRPDRLGGSREPLQVGAELFGSASPEADTEIVRLMIETLGLAGIQHPHLDLGHVGVYRSLARAAGLDPEPDSEMFDALHRKSLPDVERMVADMKLAPKWRELFLALPRSNGPIQELSAVAEPFARADPSVNAALERLRQVAGLTAASLPELPVYFDLAELRGYRYHTGIVFSAFAPGLGCEIARGGRYDNVCDAGDATGFSADIRQLLRFGVGDEPGPRGCIAAPSTTDPACLDTISRLRAQGEQVVVMLPDQSVVNATVCDRVLRSRDGCWVAEKLEQEQ